MSEFMTPRRCIYCQLRCTDDGELIPAGVSIDKPDEQLEYGLCNECADKHPLAKRELKPDERIALARRVLARHTFEVGEGFMVDAQTANAIVTVYDGLTPESRKKFVARPLDFMAELAWKLVK